MSINALGIPSSHAVRVVDVPDPQVPEQASRRSCTATFEADMPVDYDAADRDGKVALLRREDLFSSLISDCRK